jgi:hypothetical protein
MGRRHRNHKPGNAAQILSNRLIPQSISSDNLPIIVRSVILQTMKIWQATLTAGLMKKSIIKMLGIVYLINQIIIFIYINFLTKETETR